MLASASSSPTAGNGRGGYDGEDGPAVQARLGAPSGIAIGPDGSLYIADTSNHRVRRVIWLRPQVVLSVSDVRPGEPLTVGGRGFRPWATSATMRAEATAAVRPAVIEPGTVALSAGAFRAVVVVPSDLAGGQHRVQASDSMVVGSSPGAPTVATVQTSAAQPAATGLPAGRGAEPVIGDSPDRRRLARAAPEQPERGGPRRRGRPLGADLLAHEAHVGDDEAEHRERDEPDDLRPHELKAHRPR